MTEKGQLVLRSLTARERTVLPLVCAGLTNRKIAERLGVSGDQVAKNYMRNILRKAGTHDRVELITFAWRHGIVQCPCHARRQFVSQQSATQSLQDAL